MGGKRVMKKRGDFARFPEIWRDLARFGEMRAGGHLRKSRLAHLGKSRQISDGVGAKVGRDVSDGVEVAGFHG